MTEWVYECDLVALQVHSSLQRVCLMMRRDGSHASGRTNPRLCRSRDCASISR